MQRVHSFQIVDGWKRQTFTYDAQEHDSVVFNCATSFILRSKSLLELPIEPTTLANENLILVDDTVSKKMWIHNEMTNE